MSHSRPVLVAGMNAGASIIAAAADRTHAIMANGTRPAPLRALRVCISYINVLHPGALYSWGYNLHGCLGDGTTASRSAPVPVRLPERAVRVAASKTSTCAALHNHQVWCWGAVGSAESAYSLSPILMFGSGASAGSILRSIVAGDRHFCVVAAIAIAACTEADSAECRASVDDVALDGAKAALAQRSVDTVW
jgi:hypothetical protein